MNLEPRIILNGQDDVARRNFVKKTLSNRVEAAVEEEFGFGSFLKSKVKKVLGMDDKKSDKDSEDSESSGSSGFDEKKHPRGEDGRFAEAPHGSLSKGLAKVQEKARDVDVKVKEDALYKAKVSQWEGEKAKWEAVEIPKANKKIKAINDGELKKANSELLKAKAYLKKNDLSDEDFEKGTKKFQEANKKVKDAKLKISKIKPAPFKAPKPKTDAPAPPYTKKKKGFISKVIDGVTYHA